MKTKLATLLIAPALLFTACGAKEISFKEAFDFVQKNYTLESAYAKANKISATWEFKFEGGDSDIQVSIIKDFFNFLVGATLKEEVKAVSGSFTDKEGTSLVLSAKTFYDFNELFMIGSKFALSGNELSISGASFTTVLINNLEFTFNDKGATKEVHGVIEKQEFKSKLSNEGDMPKTIEGKLDITFSDFDYTPKL